jgi:hypothetical protein
MIAYHLAIPFISFSSVTPAWLEHATCGLGNRCSIRLSYGVKCFCFLQPSSILSSNRAATATNLRDARRLQFHGKQCAIFGGEALGPMMCIAHSGCHILMPQDPL